MPPKTGFSWTESLSQRYVRFAPIIRAEPSACGIMAYLCYMIRRFPPYLATSPQSLLSKNP